MDLKEYNVAEIDLKTAININGGTDEPYDRGYEIGKRIGHGILVGIGIASTILAFL